MGLFLPLAVGAGVLALIFASSSSDAPTAAVPVKEKEKDKSPPPSPAWKGKVIVYGKGTALEQPAFDGIARAGIVRALLRDELVASDAKEGDKMWTAQTRWGTGAAALNQGKTDLQKPKYLGTYVGPATRALHFVAQALASGRAVFAPIEWAEGDVTKPLPLDPDRSNDLVAVAATKVASPNFALLFSPGGPDPSAYKAAIADMLTKPSDEFDREIAAELAKMGEAPSDEG
jgi:hypothetical protein